MTQLINDKDLLLLSAYLDGELKDRQRTRLESRLNAEPELQQTLLELRQTHYLLRHASRKKVPHSFTLTPAMVAERVKSPQRFLPVLSLSSVMAAILMIVVYVSGVAPRASQISTLAAMPAMESAAPQAMGSQKSAATPQILNWIDPSNFGMGGGGGSDDLVAKGLGGDDGDMADQERASAASVENYPATSTPQFPVYLPPGTGGELFTAPQPTQPAQLFAAEPTQPVQLVAPTETSQALLPIEGNGPILGLRTADEAERENSQALAVPRGTENQAQPAPSNLPLYAVIALAGIALISGFAAIFIWLKARH